MAPSTLRAQEAATTASEPIGEGWLLDRRELRFPASEVDHLEIANDHGDVRIRPAPGEEILLLGLAQRHADDPRRARFDAATEDGTWRLTVGWLAGRGDEQRPEEWARRRIDISLLVPAAAVLEVVADDGLVEARGVLGDVTVRTTTGEISIATHGSIDAESVHGAIRAQLRRADWSFPPRFRTVNGDIMIVLPRVVRATARLATRGEITTDFSLDIERDLDTGEKEAVGRIAGGGTEIEAISVNGAIKLLQTFLEGRSVDEDPGGSG